MRRSITTGLDEFPLTGGLADVQGCWLDARPRAGLPRPRVPSGQGEARVDVSCLQEPRADREDVYAGTNLSADHTQ